MADETVKDGDVQFMNFKTVTTNLRGGQNKLKPVNWKGIIKSVQLAQIAVLMLSEFWLEQEMTAKEVVHNAAINGMSVIFNHDKCYGAPKYGDPRGDRRGTAALLINNQFIEKVVSSNTGTWGEFASAVCLVNINY